MLAAVATPFGKYLLLHKLAEGGMAEVFLARQSGLEGFEKPVVIKRILPRYSDEPRFVEMFLNEARVAARLTHPALVHIYELGQIDGQYYIAMEFVHGEDLRALVETAEQQERRPPAAIACRIVADTLGGLHYAHTRTGKDGQPLGLVHRDVSPQNVLVTYEGGVKLVDFGIAKATQAEQGANQTQVGLLKGKYAYMSPEQCRGQALDARSDIFSVGILLWELVAWRRLFRRGTDLATLVAVVEDPIPTLEQAGAHPPPELSRIVMRALARSPDERYPSAQAMQADLEALIRAQGWEADSIRLQRYVREVCADRLAQQTEAMREAGVGSIEDLLARVDEHTRITVGFLGPRLLSTPSAGLALPEAPALAVPPPAPSPTPVAPRPSRAGTTSRARPWVRAAVVFGTATVVSLAGFFLLFRPL